MKLDLEHHPAVFDALRLFGRQAIHGGDVQSIRRGLCIASTAIAMRVLDHFCIDATPLPVEALLVNAACRLWTEENGITETAEEVAAARAAGAYAVHIGVGDPAPGKWAGHLLAVTAGPCPWMIDLSLDQADRPEHDLILPPVVCPTTPEFVAGDEIESEGPRGVLLRYTPRPDNQRFREAPDWKDTRRHRRAAAEIINAAKSLISARINLNRQPRKVT